MINLFVCEIECDGVFFLRGVFSLGRLLQAGKEILPNFDTGRMGKLLEDKVDVDAGSEGIINVFKEVCGKEHGATEVFKLSEEDFRGQYLPALFEA
jgi:hypothetical protein